MIKKYGLIKRLNPEDYVDDNAKNLIKSIKIDLLPATMENPTEGDYDCFCLLEGKVGSSKSTLASLLSMAIDDTYQTNIRTIYRDWHYWKFKNMLTKDYRKDIDCSRGKAVSFDELRRVLHARDSMSPEVKDIEKDLGDIRTLGIFWTACIDDYKSVLRYLRDTRVDIWIYIKKRGVAWIYKLYTIGKDNYKSEKRMAFIKKMLLKGIHPYTPYKIYYKPIPKNSLFWIKFKQRELKYKIASKESKKANKKSELIEKRKDFYEETYSYTETRKVLGVSDRTMMNWIKAKRATLNNKKYSFKWVDTLRGRRWERALIHKLYRIMYPIGNKIVEAEE